MYKKIIKNYDYFLTLIFNRNKNYELNLMNYMPQKKKSSTIEVSEKKSSNSLRTAYENSGNNYLTLSNCNLKYSINSLTSSLNKKVNLIHLIM